MSTYLLGILWLGVLEESLLVQGAGILSPGVGAFHTAFENGTVSSWIFIIASSQVFGDDKSRVFSPVCSCIWILCVAKISRKHEKKNELKSVEFTHSSAKYSLKSENSPAKPKWLLFFWRDNVDPWIKMQDTLILAGSWAINTLTSISDVDCQIYPLVSKAPEGCWERSEQVSRPCDNCLRVGWKGGRLGDRRLFSGGGCCSLTCAFWPGHYPLRARAGEIQQWITFFSKTPVYWFFFSFQRHWLSWYKGKICGSTKRKMWWPKFLLLSRVYSCLYQVPSLIFLPFALSPCISVAIWNVLKMLTTWFFQQTGWDIFVMSV